MTETRQFFLVLGLMALAMVVIYMVFAYGRQHPSEINQVTASEITLTSFGTDKQPGGRIFKRDDVHKFPNPLSTP